MTVTVNGLRGVAEHACRMVFGEDANLGPQRAAPEPRLKLLADWPAPPEAVGRVGLELPIDFDIGHEMMRNGRKSVVLQVNRITVMHGGQAVGYALRTDALGLNAIDQWTSSWKRFKAAIN